MLFRSLELKWKEKLSDVELEKWSNVALKQIGEFRYDSEEYVKNKFKGKDVTYEKTVLEDGTIIFDIQTSQIKQRCSFTEI